MTLGSHQISLGEQIPEAELITTDSEAEPIVREEERVESWYQPVSLGLGWSYEPKSLDDLVREVLKLQVFLSAPGHDSNVMVGMQLIR